MQIYTYKFKIENSKFKICGSRLIFLRGRRVLQSMEGVRDISVIGAIGVIGIICVISVICSGVLILILFTT